MNTYGFTITSAGWQLLTKLLKGETLEITRVMVGKGRVPDDVNPATLTDLVAPVASATSTEPAVDGNTVSFVVEYRSDLNGGLEESFWLGEFGIFARDPDVGEILLYYGTLGDYPQPVSAYSNGAVDIRRFPCSIILTDELEAVLAYPALAFMTAEDVEQYVMVTALPVILDRAGELIDVHNVDPQAHPDIRNTASQHNSRITRLEDMMFNNVTGNPYSIYFDTLDGLIVEGVYNIEMQRIEF